jgi:outer membrane protein assembly factor BamB
VPIDSPPAWTQFRLQNSNNAVVPGTLEASWQLHTGGPFSSSPTIASGTLFVGNNNGGLYAIDAASGKTLWTYHLDNPIMSAAIVYQDLVIVGEGNENSPQSASPSHPIKVGSPPNALLAFDRRTGALRWRVPLPGTGMPSPAIIDGVLVHHNGAGYVYALDPQTGRVLYSRNLHSIASMTSALPLGNGRFATTGVDDNAVWAINVKDGTTAWRSTFSQTASGIGDCPAVTDGRRIYCNYVMPPSPATPVQTEREAVVRAYAIDAQTGTRLWDVVLDSGVLPIRNEAAIPLLYNGMVYSGSSVAPYMHALDAATGALKWKTQIRGTVKGGIVQVGGVLYFGDLGGYLWAVDAATGRVIGDKKIGAPFNVGSPVAVGQTLVIGSRGGTLVAVPLRTIREGRDT